MNYKQMIGAGKVSQVLETLQKDASYDQDFKDDILALQSRWAKLEKDIRRGILSQDQQTLQRARIVAALLSHLGIADDPAPVQKQYYSEHNLEVTVQVQDDACTPWGQLQERWDIICDSGSWESFESVIKTYFPNHKQEKALDLAKEMWHATESIPTATEARARRAMMKKFVEDLHREDAKTAVKADRARIKEADMFVTELNAEIKKIHGEKDFRLKTERLENLRDILVLATEKFNFSKSAVSSADTITRRQLTESSPVKAALKMLERERATPGSQSSAFLAHANEVYTAAIKVVTDKYAEILSFYISKM